MGLLLLFGFACSEAATTSRSSGFRTGYLSARGALEGGNYDTAARRFAALIPEAGPLEIRLRLEYAHSLLRADRFEDASAEAARIAANASGKAKAGALAVQATADHEIAQAAIGRGDRGDGVRARLTAAKAAMDAVLGEHADLDPLGALAARRREVTAALAAL